jgi:Ser/Thr protein kinase RdoA (MazF antagonist)
MMTLLPGLRGERRRTALANYVAGAEAIAVIEYPDRLYGQILAPAPIRAETWTGYLRRSLDRALLRNGAVIAAEIGDIEDLRAKALTLVEPLEPRPKKALVHGDYFPGNVLLDGALAVSGLVDFSVYTVVGDPTYDLITAPIFLEMIHEATPADVETVRGLVRARLGDAIRRAARCYRVHAAFVMADPAHAAEPYPEIYPWSLATLRQLAKGALPD